MANVFVYGTLLYDGVVEALLDKTLKNTPAVLQGYQRYKKEIPNGKSWGPAIIEEESAKVEGRIVFNLDERDLNIFDRFELSADDAYERIKCQVSLEDGQELEVFTYIAKEKVRPFLRGEWPQADFEEIGLEHYINERIPDLRKKWGIDKPSVILNNRVKAIPQP